MESETKCTTVFASTPHLCLLLQLCSWPAAVFPTQKIAPTSLAAANLSPSEERQIFGARWTAAISQNSSPSPVSFPCWVSLAVFQPHGTQFITHSCSAGSIWEPRSANYETSPGTFIYYGAKPEVMDTSKVLLSLKGGNSSRSGPQERLYHTCIHTYTQAYLEGRRAALNNLLTLAITPLGPSLHLLPLLFFYPRCVYRCVYILQISSQPDHIAKQLLGGSL